MRTSPTCTVLATVSALILTCSPARSQDSQPCIFSEEIITGYVVPSPHGTPFSAVVKATYDHTLADGNTIHGTVRYRLARDSSGKTLVEKPSGCSFSEDGHRHQLIEVHVEDSSAQTSADWLVNNVITKIAIIAP